MLFRPKVCVNRTTTVFQRESANDNRPLTIKLIVQNLSSFLSPDRQDSSVIDSSIVDPSSEASETLVHK